MSKEAYLTILKKVRVAVFAAISGLILFTSFVFSVRHPFDTQAAGVESLFVYVSDDRSSVSSGLIYEFGFTVDSGTLDGAPDQIEIFFDDPAFSWCKSNGALNASGISSSEFDADAGPNMIDISLPGVVGANCVGGDRIVVEYDGILNAGVTYGLRVVGNVGVLGTPAGVGNHNMFFTQRSIGTIQPDKDVEFRIRLVANNSVTISAQVVKPPPTDDGGGADSGDTGDSGGDDGSDSGGDTGDAGSDDGDGTGDDGGGGDNGDGVSDSGGSTGGTDVGGDSGGSGTPGGGSSGGGNIIRDLVSAVEDVTKRVVDVIIENSKVTIPVILTTNIVITGLSNLGLLNMTFLELPILISRGFLSLLSLLGLRRKPVPYGFVYDAVTKEPVPHALVRIFNQDRKLVYSDVTDAYGVFGVKLAVGVYSMEVRKREYNFPSQLVKSVGDYPIDNVYTGGEFTVKRDDSEIYYGVPIDPVENEKSLILSVLKERLNLLFKFLNLLSLTVGLVLSFIAYTVSAGILNFILLVTYIPIMGFTLYTWFYKPPYGKAMSADGMSMSGVVLGLKNLDDESIVSKRITNKGGEFRFIAPAGRYSIEALQSGYELSGNYQNIEIRKGRDRMGVIAPDLTVTINPEAL